MNYQLILFTALVFSGLAKESHGVCPTTNITISDVHASVGDDVLLIFNNSSLNLQVGASKLESNGSVIHEVKYNSSSKILHVVRNTDDRVSWVQGRPSSVMYKISGVTLSDSKLYDVVQEFTNYCPRRGTVILRVSAGPNPTTGSSSYNRRTSDSTPDGAPSSTVTSHDSTTTSHFPTETVTAGAAEADGIRKILIAAFMALFYCYA